MPSEFRHRSRSHRLAQALGWILTFVFAAVGAAHALAPTVAYSLRDGPPPDGSADDLILPPDSNFARVFVSVLFDAEFYVEFPMAGASMTDDANLALAVQATDIDLVLGESKTFRLSVYEGNGTASLSAFGSGTIFESVVLPTNGAWHLDIDVTDLWNDAVLDGHAYFGIRIHDPIWTGSAQRAGTIIVGSAVLEGVPEPETGLLGGAALFAIAELVQQRRRRSP